MTDNILLWRKDHLKFGKINLKNINIDLFVLSHPKYPIEGYEKYFITFEINYN